MITKETKEKLIDLLDSLKDFGVGEIAERPLYSLLIDTLDKYASKKIPDHIEPKINEALSLALDKQYEEAIGIIGEILDELIDFEKIDDELEHLIFVDGLRFILRQILLYLEKKKKE